MVGGYAGRVGWWIGSPHSDGCFVDWRVYWLVQWLLFHWLVAWSVRWLVGWIDVLVGAPDVDGWLVCLLVHGLVGGLFLCWLPGWLIHLLVAGLSLLAGWMGDFVGFLACCLCPSLRRSVVLHLHWLQWCILFHTCALPALLRV